MADSNLILPGEFEKGRNYILKGETLIAWRDALLADRAIPGHGVHESATPMGRIFTVDPAVIVETRPLAVIAGDAANKVRIAPGTVNGEMPTIGGAFLNSATPPQLTISADETWVWVRCERTYSGGPSTVTIETSTSYSTPAGSTITPSGFVSFHVLGKVISTSGAVAEIVNIHGGGNLGVESFGNVNLWWGQ